MASPEEMAAKMRENALEKTGRAISDWFVVLSDADLEKHGEMLKLLKGEHGVTHGFANLIVHDFKTQGTEPTDLVGEQYTGKKEHLRPIYDAIIASVDGFGDDVEVSPKKAYVSLRRSKQFATVGPATNAAVEVGLNLKGQDLKERLVAGRGMVTHRVRLGAPDEVDDELVAWLRTAYGAA